VSPLAQKKRLQTVVDESADQYQTILFSGGRRGLEIELAPDDLISLCGAKTGSICSF
ncbi:MAG: Cys-tRNA(Pro) deacylase, partial [Desulfofustis sp.]|nr:Cys-tRNA(Pro) deacylase [Desulfofustis sp.]